MRLLEIINREMEYHKLARYEPGVWHQGILSVANNVELTESPMKLLKKVEGNQVAREESYSISICKQSLLSTYQLSNQYSNPSKNVGCEINAADQSKCKFPAVVVVSISDTLQTPQVQNPDDLNVTVFTGFPEKVSPDLLFASQIFLESYGFNKNEVIWYRHITPLPLERVMLTHEDADTERVMLNCAEKVVSQMYEKSRNELVAVQQDFTFSMRVKLPRSLAKPSDSGPEVISENEEDSVTTADDIESVDVYFRILECSPVLQGRITDKTTIAYLPPDEDQDTGDSASLYGEENTRVRSASNASASDFKYEVDAKPPIRPTALGIGYIIEAVPVSNFKLQSHCIVLPKESAVAHKVYSCQPVWVSSTDKVVVSSPNKKSLSLRDLAVPVVNPEIRGGHGAESVNKPRHLSVAFHYEDSFQLEKYVPLPSLGKEYTSEELTRAYIHPELLFYLYPETLSSTRRYFIDIMVS